MRRLPKSDTNPWVLGLSASHNGGACLLRGDRIIAAIQEERLSRTKRDRTFGSKPSLATAYCLGAAGITAADLDLVVFCCQGHARSQEQDLALNPQLRLDHNDVPWRVISHHLGHAVSAFATSGMADAAVLVIDGIGSPYEDLCEDEQSVAVGGPNGWEMISLYHGSGTRLRPVEKQMVANGEWLAKRPVGMPRFRTLGGMYSAVATQIFGDPLDAGKVMGLAPYGKPELATSDFLALSDGRFRFHDTVPDRFPHDRRWPDNDREYRDLARSVQEALEVAVLSLAERLRQLVPSSDLSYCGGVALNCVLNEKLFRQSGYHSLYIPPAAEDSGPAIGAAYYGLWQLTGSNRRRKLSADGVGRTYSISAVDRAVRRVPGLQVTLRGQQQVLDETVRRLREGQIVGWFQGPSELGPRALGRRSILADPRGPEIQDRINRRVKGREWFRPFAPVILSDRAAEWFDLDGFEPDSPFMLRIWQFQAAARELLPAVVHVDGTGRVQTVSRDDDDPYCALLRRFEAATEVPILLNTSFNGRGEPIVETPEDALWCLLRTGLDFAVLEDRLIERRPTVRSLLDLTPGFSADAYMVEIPLVDGGFSTAAPAGASLTFRVSTPWGPRQEEIADNMAPLLGTIDGVTDGWQLRERLSQRIGSEIEPSWLVDTLARLRNASILTFRDTLSAEGETT